MRIGIDARPLQHETQFRGIGKSLEFLLRSLATLLNEDDSVVFYVDEGAKLPPVIECFSGSKIITIASMPIARKRYIRSVLPPYKAVAPKKSECDVFLQYDASFGVPVTVPTVVIFHDLIPYLFRDKEKKVTAKGLRRAKNSLARTMYWRRYLAVLKKYPRAKQIIAISESSKNDYQKYVNKKPQPIAVVHHGVSKTHLLGTPSAAIKKIARDPFLLYVGGIDLRKNIVELVRSFYELKAKHPSLKLVTVGKEFGLSDQLSDLGWTAQVNSNKRYKKDIIIPGFVSDTDLGYLYSQAKAFVFPSFYEGFGLPVLEAMQAGCPVVAYSNSSIPEIAGDAAIVVKDGTPMAPLIEKLLTDKKLRSKLITAGKKQAATFTWEKAAAETVAILKKQVV